jgi:hypothetical protein
MEYFPAVRDPGSIDLLLNFIRQNTPPPLIDVEYLRNAGFRRDGDNALVDLLVFLGFTDADGRPASMWKAYAADRAGRLLPEAVRRSYARLYDVFPDPEARDADELMPFFRKLTGSPDTDLAFMILTFRVLRDIAGPVPPPAPAPAAAPAAALRPSPAGLHPHMAQPAQAAKIMPDRGSGMRIEQTGDTRLKITIEVDGAGDPELAALVKALLARALKA